MAGHMSIKGVYSKLGKRNTKGSLVDTGGVCRQREHVSLLQVLLKPTTNGKGRTR
jgi:hypothetical protein